VTRKILFIAALSLVACNKQTTTTVAIQTATAQRRDLIVEATATGVIEPITVVEVKSKTASGQVIDMNIEVGSYIRPGDLIIQIDTTDLHTSLLQLQADLEAQRSSHELAKTVLDRNTAFYNQRIITKDVLEQSQNSFTSATASLQRAQTQVTLQLQKLKDSRVVAAAEGTVLTRPVARGQVVQAGSGGVSSGTVIATMADLSKVRARTLVSETEIGQITVGQNAVVTVDAFPERAFNGQVEKIEPSAVVQQNVTMFPVLISLDNSEGLLRPGMNGEVNVRTDERGAVLSIPNDAIRNVREWEISARALKLDPDSVRSKVMPQGGGRGGFGGANGGTRGGNAPAGAAPPAGPQASTSRAELDPVLLQGGGDRQGGRGGRGQMPEVTDAQCAAVTKALAAKPAVSKKLDDIRAGMRGASDEDRQKMRTQQEAAYKELGVDQMVAGACRFRAGGGRGGQQGGVQQGGVQQGGGQQGAGNQGGGATQGGAMAGGAGGAGGGRRGGRGGAGGAGRRVDPNATPRSGMVFVQKGDTWEPRVLRLGIANYDFTEVVSGLEEGEKVAMLNAAILQLRRQEQTDRMKAGASPLGGSPGGMGGPGGGRGPGGGGPGGGGPGGGRGN
jgi:HlyD family secretion protein